MLFLQPTDIILSYAEWEDRFDDELNCFFAETGADRELDFNREAELSSLYSQYVTKHRWDQDGRHLEDGLDECRMCGVHTRPDPKWGDLCSGCISAKEV